MKLSRKHRQIASLIMMTGFFFILLVVILIFFSIQTVTIVGTSDLLGLKEIYHRPIFLISETNLAEQLYKKNPGMQSVIVRKIYPNKISIIVKSNSAIAQIQALGGYVFLDEQGKIIRKIRTKINEAPLITGPERRDFTLYVPGEVVASRDIEYSLYFIGFLRTIGLVVSGVDIRGLDVIICKIDDKTIYFTTSRDKLVQIADIKAIVKNFTIKNIEYESIDVRFNRPIVKLKKTVTQ